MDSEKPVYAIKRANKRIATALNHRGKLWELKYQNFNDTKMSALVENKSELLTNMFL